jgi:exonuclease III
MSVKMKGICWNSNGLRDQAKPRFLFEASKEHMLDFIALLETKRSNFNSNELAHFCGGHGGPVARRHGRFLPAGD